ncbi:hypothetical protein [Arthrobacter sp. YN]|uniref:hypothetical protein n=1 Tax=Arthrobacter sp. YN TaxID=2020486 RepID=UPI000B5E87C7|nr:hypothetical protein [Arthrobacter sp. YN]ASN19936.1 hypothetical protein CGK93_09805 [Arthrobacter sp. YN]
MANDQLPDRSAQASIQGYQYQFVLSIIEILRASEDSIVTIEGLEDIDVFSPDDDVAVQCKYLEKAKYSSTVLRKPILAMLAAHAAGKRNNFVLHVYFGDGTAPERLTLDELKICLTERKRKPEPKTVLHYESFNDADLEDFCARLEIRAGERFATQEEMAKKALEKALKCSRADVESLHYPSALVKIQELAMNVLQSDRRTSRQEFIDRLNIKTQLYTRWHRELVTVDNYLKALSVRLRQSGVLGAQRKRGVMIELDAVAARGGLVDAREFFRVLAHEGYGISKLNTSKPWTVIVETNEESYLALKRALLEEGIIFNDGYEHIRFDSAIFDRPPIFNTKPRSSTISSTSYDIRVMSRASFDEFIRSGYSLDVLICAQVDDHGEALSKASSKEVHVPAVSFEQLIKVMGVPK